MNEAGNEMRDGIEQAALWHDSEDKALSKQPPSGDRGWRRMQHQEQAANLRALLATPSIESEIAVLNQGSVG